jgi:hypothetical protein
MRTVRVFEAVDGTKTLDAAKSAVGEGSGAGGRGVTAYSRTNSSAPTNNNHNSTNTNTTAVTTGKLSWQLWTEGGTTDATSPLPYTVYPKPHEQLGLTLDATEYLLYEREVRCCV